MSLGEYRSAPPGTAGMSSPNSFSEWNPRDFTDDLLLDSAFDQNLNLTPEEERLFRSFGDGLDSSLSYTFDSVTEAINERQAVYAEAQAAGLFKGGIRRAAFSMGDLQALQPPEPPSPKLQITRPPVSSAAAASKPPRLESVPESIALPTTSALLSGGDILMSSRISGLSTGSLTTGISDGALEGLALDQLSSDLLAGGSGSAYDSDVPMPMYEEGHSTSEGPSHMEALSVPMIKSEPGSSLGMPPLPAPPGKSQGFPTTSPTNSGGLFDYSFIGRNKGKKPPLPPNASTSFASPLVNLDSALALRGYADELLGSAMPSTSQGKAPQKGPQGLKDSLDEQKDKDQQRQRMLRRSQSAVELRSMSGALPRHGSTGELQQRHLVELTTPEGHTYTAGRLSNEERAQKILRYRQKRHERNFNKRIKYMCRKTLADSRPRVRGRFARNDDAAAVMPHETKKALAEKARKEKKEAAAAAARRSQDDSKASLLDGPVFTSDFSALISDPIMGGSNFSQTTFLPGADGLDFPPVPLELYGRPSKSGGSSGGGVLSGGQK